MIDPRLLRAVCAHFATGVTVVTAGEKTHTAGTTVNSFTSVSLDPPLVLFCLHRRSRLRPVLTRAGGFVVNFLTGKQESLAWMFAGRASGDAQAVAYRRSAHGLPILEPALAFLACQLTDEYEGGDHTIVVGEVIELGTADGDEAPLIFYRGAMRELESS